LPISTGKRHFFFTGLSARISVDMNTDSNMDSRHFAIFMDVHRGLPRQGPGCAQSTGRAFALCTDFPERPEILDMGCGPGAQTLDLAALTEGHITAIDNYPPFVDDVTRRARQAKAGSRISARVGDMGAPDLPLQSVDLIWAEGSAYILGFERALHIWKDFPKPGGYLAATELVWLKAQPPEPVAGFFRNEYPAMTDVATRAANFDACGYALAGHFTLPDAAWWDAYYTPLARRLPLMRKIYKGNDAALRIIETTEREIDLRRRYSDWYGYEFFVARKP